MEHLYFRGSKGSDFVLPYHVKAVCDALSEEFIFANKNESVERILVFNCEIEEDSDFLLDTGRLLYNAYKHRMNGRVVNFTIIKDAYDLQDNMDEGGRSYKARIKGIKERARKKNTFGFTDKK